MSLGRPGRCTSPAEIMVVTPPLRNDSIQLSWLWRGVQSPNTGCTWLSMRPGATVVPLASTVLAAPDVSTADALPTSTKDRQRVVEGKSGSVRVDIGGRRNIKKKKQ